MSVATWVTISVITIPSGSRAKERSTFKEPLCHIVQRWSSKNRCCGALANMLQKAISATRHESTITPMAMPWLARLPYRFCKKGPKAVFKAAPSSGKNGISHSQERWTACATASPAPACAPAAAACAVAACPACSASAARSGKVMSSLAQEVGLFHVDGAEGLVDGQHDGEPHRGLRRRQHDHEDAEDLTGQLSRPLDEMVEGNEVHVGGVQDQLHAHQDADGVAPGDDGDHSQGEEDRADDEEVGKTDGAHSATSEVSLISLRAITTAPMSAESSTTEAISNGSR